MKRPGPLSGVCAENTLAEYDINKLDLDVRCKIRFMNLIKTVLSLRTFGWLTHTQEILAHKTSQQPRPPGLIHRRRRAAQLPAAGWV